MTRTNDAQRLSAPTLLGLGAACGIALTLTTGALAIRGGLWRAPDATATRHAPAGDAAAADEAARQRAQLAKQNEELRRSLMDALARASGCDDAPAARTDSPSTVPSDLPPQPPPPEARDDPTPEEIVAQEKAEVVSLQGEISQEPVDPVWGPATEQATARRVAATQSMHLEEVTCRESLCRVRVTHRDLAKRDDDVEKLLQTASPGGQARVYAPADEPTTVMYFSRKGMLLSVMSPRPPWVPPPPVPPAAGAAEAPPQRAN